MLIARPCPLSFTSYRLCEFKTINTDTLWSMIIITTLKGFGSQRTLKARSIGTHTVDDMN